MKTKLLLLFFTTCLAWFSPHVTASAAENLTLILNQNHRYELASCDYALNRNYSANTPIAQQKLNTSVNLAVVAKADTTLMQWATSGQPAACQIQYQYGQQQRNLLLHNARVISVSQSFGLAGEPSRLYLHINTDALTIDSVPISTKQPKSQP